MTHSGMKIKLATWILTGLLLVLPLTGYSQDTPFIERVDFSMTVGARAWLSTGHSEFNFGGPGGFPPLISELKWKNLKSEVVELRGQSVFAEEYLLNLGLGFGSVHGGTLRDGDFDVFRPPRGNDPGISCPGLCSESMSHVSGSDLSFFRVEFGYRVWTWGEPHEGHPSNSVDLLVGYLRWRETYEAARAVQTLDRLSSTPQLGPLENQGLAIWEELTWNSFLLGVQSRIEPIQDLSFFGKVMFIPLTVFQLDDTHPLRTTGPQRLRQDPSFRATAAGGYGTQVEASVSYRLWHGLSVEVGYQLWYLRSGSGIISARTVDVGDIPQQFNMAETWRHGVIVGLNYTF